MIFMLSIKDVGSTIVRTLMSGFMCPNNNALLRLKKFKSMTLLNITTSFFGLILVINQLNCPVIIAKSRAFRS